MSITLDHFVDHMEEVLDQVIATGEPVEIERNGRTLRLMVEREYSKLDRIVPIPGLVVGDSEDFVSMDWSIYWSPEDNGH